MKRQFSPLPLGEGQGVRAFRGLSSARSLREGRVWYVEFSNSQSLPQLRAALALAGLKVEEQPILDYAGQPVLVLLHPTGDRKR